MNKKIEALREDADQARDYNCRSPQCFGCCQEASSVAFNAGFDSAWKEHERLIKPFLEAGALEWGSDTCDALDAAVADYKREAE